MIKRILSINPDSSVFLTNRINLPEAWPAPAEFVADEDFQGYDGTIEIAVWRRSYRVYRWRDGSRLPLNHRFFIKSRE